MRAFQIVLGFSFAIVLPVMSLAGDAECWKDESIEAAERLVQKARAAVGDLRHFEAEFSISRVDKTFETETLGRGHVYFEAPYDGLLEWRSTDTSQKKPHHRSRSGKLFDLRTLQPQTWHWKKGFWTQIDETTRTYAITPVKLEPPKADAKGWTAAMERLQYVRTWCVAIPPCLDPDIEWKEWQSAYRIANAASKDNEFAVRFVLRDAKGLKPRNRDFRLQGDHILVLDRRTFRPKRWGLEDPVGSEQAIQYTRFDVNPLHRDLKIELSRYQPQASPSPAEFAKIEKEEERSRLCWKLSLRALLWLCL